jgi:carboxypeptidase Q
MVSPQTFPVIAYPKAYAPSTRGTFTYEVIHLNLKGKTAADLNKNRNQLAGKIVLVSNARELKANFEAAAARRRWRRSPWCGIFSPRKKGQRFSPCSS